jgi:hypothetical protein
MNPIRETLKQAGYKMEYKLRPGVYVLRDLGSGKCEVWYANKGHASYGIKYRNTDLEFGYSDYPYASLSV